MNAVTVVGQGYVGLPLAQAAVRVGWRVHGLDVSERVVANLSAGRSHVDDLSDEEIGAMLMSGYSPTLDGEVVGESSVIVICVPTPLDDDGGPDLSAVRASAQLIGSLITPGSLVILESTTYPGSTDRELVPILEQASGLDAKKDFFVAFSPERVDPGRKDYGIANTPKLVGGIDDVSTQRAVEFYSTFVESVVAMRGAKEAETAKLLENTFRHVNIALVNEMTKFCHELDIDIWDVIRGASTKPFGFMKFTPGPGVGGHCIPIDPNYLSHEVRRSLGYPFRFVELAQEVNNSMPTYIVTRAQDRLNEESKALRGSQILLLGVTYKANIADQRESPAVPIAELFRKKGAHVSFHDPHVTTWNLNDEPLNRVADLRDAVQSADLVVLLQAHDAYDVEDLSSSAVALLDTRGISPVADQRL